MDNTHKPTFIGIGFQRCGTSWLNQVLYEHPNIGKPESGIHFFNKKFELGPYWYEHYLSKFDTGNGVVGEFCTAYSYPDVAKDVADKIHLLYPNAKILMSIREPVSRCISDLQRSLRRGDISYRNESLVEIIQDNRVLMQRSYYSDIIEHYYSLFPRDQIKVILYDDIVNDPRKVFCSICDFLGVDKDFHPANLNEKLGATYSMKFVMLERVVVDMQKIAKFVLSWFPNFIRKPIAKIGRRAVLEVRERNVQTETNGHDELNIFLRNKFDDDIKALAEITKLDLDHWLSRH